VTTFLYSVLLFSGLLLIVAVPVIFVARGRGKSSTIRNFIIGAAATGTVLAIVKFTSDRTVRQCIDAGNAETQCVDFGSTGMAVMFIGGYTVIALGRAWVLSR
jgi:hypothetical protein